MQENDIVGRRSYNLDVVFKIVKIIDDLAILEGIYIRLIATAPISDLVIIDEKELQRLQEVDQAYYSKVTSLKSVSRKHITGKILHIDSDQNYLEKCLRVYRDLGIYAYGVFLESKEIASRIIDLIKQSNPDIVIMTGHDGYNKKGISNLDNYTNTKDYLLAVKEIRKVYSKDHIFIFAGACQSNFEAIIAAGANFASSPSRINIDAYDPAIIGVKAATTSLTSIISMNEINTHTNTPMGGIGGVESYGKMRLLM